MANIRTALFSEKLLSSHFFIVIPLTLQLLFRNNCFFRVSAFYDELLFQNRHFSAAVIFSEQLFFQSEISTKQPSLENRKIFRVASFRNSYSATFLAKELFRIKIQKSYFFEAATSAQHQLFQKSCILEKKRFVQKSNIPHQPLFLESYLFSAASFSKDVIFYSSYHFEKATFSQHTVLDELPFYSYPSFPQLHFLFISQ